MEKWAIVKNNSRILCDYYEVAQVNGFAIYGMRHLETGEKTFGEFDNPHKAITECSRLNQIAEIMQS